MRAWTAACLTARRLSSKGARSRRVTCQSIQFSEKMKRSFNAAEDTSRVLAYPRVPAYTGQVGEMDTRRVPLGEPARRNPNTMGIHGSPPTTVLGYDNRQLHTHQNTFTHHLRYPGRPRNNVRRIEYGKIETKSIDPFCTTMLYCVHTRILRRVLKISTHELTRPTCARVGTSTKCSRNQQPRQHAYGTIVRYTSVCYLLLVACLSTSY